ncbi:MAG: hypothetical protein BGO87_10945 [Flavobacteriia bacterium 40-80]|nr:MAG: hypothetical protein BGO87_10945 [Flavobacteriia bacterium 40-80]
MADLNPVGPPPGADLGDVFTDQNGKEWLFEQFEGDPEGKWYPTVTGLKVTPSPTVIQNDKYYRPTGHGYIESGLVYSDAIKGSDLIQKMNEWQVQAEKHAELSAMERYAKYEAAAQKQAVYEYNRSQNLFGIIYSVFADPAVQIGKNVYEGHYAAASADLAIMFFFGGVGKTSRGLWKLTDAGASAIKNHRTWGKFYKGSDGLWWAEDITKHGSSRFKVFKETDKGLEWINNADEFGDFIRNQHKSPTGKFIPWGELKTIK